MKRTVYLAAITLLAGCSSGPSLESIRAELRDELRKEFASSSPQTPVSSTPAPTPTPTPNPTATPYQLPEPTQQAMTEAVDALFALNSKVTTGISFTNYTQDIGNTKVIIDKAFRQKDFMRHPARQDIFFSFSDYELAKDIWSCYINNVRPATAEFLTGFCLDLYGPRLKQDYGVQPFESDNPILTLKDSLGAVWAKAGRLVQSAQTKLDAEPLSENQPIATPTPQPTAIATQVPIATPTPAPTVMPDYAKTYLSGLVELAGKPMLGATVKLQAASVNYLKEVGVSATGEYIFLDAPSGVPVSITVDPHQLRVVGAYRELTLVPNPGKERLINRINFNLTTF